VTLFFAGMSDAECTSAASSPLIKKRLAQSSCPNCGGEYAIRNRVTDFLYIKEYFRCPACRAQCEAFWKPISSGSLYLEGLKLYSLPLRTVLTVWIVGGDQPTVKNEPIFHHNLPD
jgi:predicted RNA-binding Zn-ribbon protein involved in translation (DUF1610 family)